MALRKPPKLLDTGSIPVDLIDIAKVYIMDFSGHSLVSKSMPSKHLSRVRFPVAALLEKYYYLIINNNIFLLLFVNSYIN